MEVQKIANFEERMQAYRDNRRAFWFRDFLEFSAIGAVVIFGLMFLFTKIPDFVPIFDLDWRELALIFLVIAMIPFVKMAHPEKPEHGDVEIDQALRRAHGMDDSVSK